MKIVHISEDYIEGWGYQENLLPLYQKRAGHDVVVVSNNEHLKYVQNKEMVGEIVKKGAEYEYDGIKIYKIKTYLNTSSTSFFCRGLYKILAKEHPDMIFHHNVNISTLSVAAKYKRRYPQVRLYADNHADWINESKNRIWHKVFCETIIPWQVKRLGDDVNYYIGVSPMRCKYLNKVYRVPEQQIKFLPIGCDTDGAEQVNNSRVELRKQYQIKNEVFVIVSGGKLDKSKGTLVLIEACDNLREKIPNLRLLLFGRIDDEVKETAKQKTWITMEGWCDRYKTLSLLKMSDVACWPWLHTTLIEDSIACGIPLVVKKSDNVSHFAKEEAGVFMEKGDVYELEKAILNVNSNYETYQRNATNAKNKFSYSTLVERLQGETFYELK